MLASVSSAVVRGVDGKPVRVEVHVGNGLPAFTVVGLPDASCREARDRVRAALLSTGLPWPQQRVTVNLAPSGLPKAGVGLDLAIAVAMLAALGELDCAVVAQWGFLGELGLDGSVRSLPGLLPMVDAIAEPNVVVPMTGTTEALVLGRHRVCGVNHLREVVLALRGAAPWPDHEVDVVVLEDEEAPELADVRGQRVGRNAVEIAAAGGHHLLMVGPPGSGKTMLAQRMPGLLPQLDAEAALETTRVHSAAGERLPRSGLVRRPPFRSPHHSASMVALIGGGSAWLRPGEIALATNGVLFLDELAEFPPSVLDALRQPLEEGRVRVARAAGSVVFPARFQLVAAMNPCPCGFAGSPVLCRCAGHVLDRYWRRVSGPVLDRFDVRVVVGRPDPTQLANDSHQELTVTVARRVADARALAVTRGVRCNADLRGAALDRFAPLEPSARRILERALHQQRLTARGFHRVRRVARTVADLEGHDGPLDEEHVSQAMGLRAEDLKPSESDVA